MKTLHQIFSSHGQNMSPALTFLMKQLHEAEDFLDSASKLQDADTPHTHHIFISDKANVVIHTDYADRTASQRVGKLVWKGETPQGTPTFELTFANVGTLQFDGNPTTRESNLLTLWHMVDGDRKTRMETPIFPPRTLAA